MCSRDASCLGYGERDGQFDQVAKKTNGRVTKFYFPGMDPRHFQFWRKLPSIVNMGRRALARYCD